MTRYSHFLSLNTYVFISAKPDMPKSRSSSRASFDGKTLAVISYKGYRVEKKLGEGAFGVVYKAVNRQGQLSAVKVIDLNKMDTSTREKYLPREISTLIDCRHENLIRVYDIFRCNYKMFIVMEFAGNGDLAGYATKHNGFKEPLACKWFLQSASGLAFLHNNMKTAHRDIKLDNILLDSNMVAKLTDFGFAKHCYDVHRNRVILSSTFCGTLPYECPQILEHHPYDAMKADDFSMGVTLFIMMFSAFPFHYRDRRQMLAEIHDYPRYIRSRYTRKLPPDATILIEQLLNPHEGNRAGVHVILANRFLQSHKAH